MKLESSNRKGFDTLSEGDQMHSMYRLFMWHTGRLGRLDTPVAAELFRVQIVVQARRSEKVFDMPMVSTWFNPGQTNPLLASTIIAVFEVELEVEVLAVMIFFFFFCFFFTIF